MLENNIVRILDFLNFCFCELSKLFLPCTFKEPASDLRHEPKQIGKVFQCQKKFFIFKTYLYI